MRISLGTYDLQFLWCSSRRELDHALQTIEGHHELIDVAQGEDSMLFVLKFIPQFKEAHAVARSVGICASRTGIEPQILWTPSTGLLYLGLNSTLLVFRADGNVIRTVPIDSPFYAMTVLEKENGVLVVHEIGILRMATTGNIEWRYDATDIVSTFHVVPGNALHLTLRGGAHLALDLNTGAPMAKPKASLGGTD